MAASAVPGPYAEPRIVVPWLPICAGIVAIMAIAKLHYAGTLFIQSLAVSLHTTLAAIQTPQQATNGLVGSPAAFTAFLLLLAETWLLPIVGRMIDGHGTGAMITLQNRSRIDSMGGKRHG